MAQFSFIIFGLLVTIATSSYAQSDQPIPDNLANFATNTGECDVTYKKDLQLQYLTTLGKFKIPRSYTIKEASLSQRRGISPPTANTLKPLQPVLCLANERDKVLVTSVDPGDRACGWVSKDVLAEVNQSDPEIAPCGEIKALKVKDFCKITKSIVNISTTTEKLIAGCNLDGVKDTSIDTKFITDNTTSRRAGITTNAALTMRKIPLFDTSNSKNPFGSVDVFSVNRVFDAKPTNTGSLRVLLGDEKAPLGWTDLDNGHICYSTLTTYFKPNGTKSVYLQKIITGFSDEENQLLATKPSAKSFNVKEDFVKFPVLFDMRRRGQMTPKRQSPQLEVAFIGKFCDGNAGQMCLSDDNKYSQALSNMRAADVVFLIDGSKSMRKYFGLVAEALTDFTEEYIANPDYRFGVAMYGDFKSNTKTNLGDPIDYKTIMDLNTNYSGNFDLVTQAELLIFDALKDKPEAVHAAVFEAAKTFNWAQDKPHFLIHIADHGDRERPSQKVFDALNKNNIFYVPIAVEGEAVLKESKTFIDDSEIYAKKYITTNGNPMAIKAIKSYGNGSTDAGENIAKALIEATSGWDDLDSGTSDGDILPVLDAAAKEIFNILETDDIQVLAATGYIETAAIGSIESNWDYFVSLDEKNAQELKSEMQDVCESLDVGDPTKTITNTVFNLVRLLTGDNKTVDEMIEIWREGSIPLQTKTIIGPGIQQLLLAASTDQDLTPYKKEFCRSSLLLNLMLKNLKLRVAEENVDLIWEGSYYDPKDQFEFQWRYTDLSGSKRLYLPLNYLPRPLN